MADSFFGKSSGLRVVSHLRLLGLSFTSLSEALWSTPKTCGRFRWFDRRGEPDLDEMPKLLQYVFPRFARLLLTPCCSISNKEWLGTWSLVTGPVKKSAERGLVDLFNKYSLDSVHVSSFGFEGTRGETRPIITGVDLAEIAAAILHAAATILVDKPHLESTQSVWWFKGGSPFEKWLQYEVEVDDVVSIERSEPRATRLREEWLNEDKAPAVDPYSKLARRAALNFWAVVRFLVTLEE